MSPAKDTAPRLDAEHPPSVGTSADSTVGAVGPTGPDAELPRFAPPAAAGELGRLGKYRIVKELGRGGMGVVYLAVDERLERQVALKVMLPKAAANPTAKDRFLREARAAARISSDHVVVIHEADEIDGVPFIALQLLLGRPLDDHLREKGTPPVARTLRIARETALGLAAAHALGLVHRDVKPGNLWLEAPGGRLKVLDFGLAKPVEGDEGAELTHTGAVMGTPAYMAPEQGMGRAVDGRADLFSLGCVLYRLVTGKLPFARPTLMAVLAAVATEDPTPVRELNPDAPEPLADLIGRLMAKDPAARPQTAMEVVWALDEVLDEVHREAEASSGETVVGPVADDAEELGEHDLIFDEPDDPAEYEFVSEGADAPAGYEFVEAEDAPPDRPSRRDSGESRPKRRAVRRVKKAVPRPPQKTPFWTPARKANVGLLGILLVNVGLGLATVFLGGYGWGFTALGVFGVVVLGVVTFVLTIRYGVRPRGRLLVGSVGSAAAALLLIFGWMWFNDRSGKPVNWTDPRTYTLSAGDLARACCGGRANVPAAGR